jgi:hypothetical protein
MSGDHGNEEVSIFFTILLPHAGSMQIAKHRTEIAGGNPDECFTIGSVAFLWH